ncbi:hypothetical protein AMECASPLE_003208, partial [Ameca splendens]
MNFNLLENSSPDQDTFKGIRVIVRVSWCSEHSDERKEVEENHGEEVGFKPRPGCVPYLSECT